MKYAVKTVNEVGIAEIANFLSRTHKKQSFTKDQLRAWADDAEFQVSEGNSPTIEVTSRGCVYGFTVTFTVPEVGVDTEMIEVEE